MSSRGKGEKPIRCGDDLKKGRDIRAFQGKDHLPFIGENESDNPGVAIGFKDLILQKAAGSGGPERLKAQVKKDRPSEKAAGQGKSGGPGEPETQKTQGQGNSEGDPPAAATKER